jgi:hypothetical protein
MITDIYIKHENEPGYTEESIVEQEEMQLLLSQIKMTLMTPNRSVLGEAAYGIDEDNYLFEFSEDFDIVNVEEQVRSQLEQYCTLLKNRDWEAKAYLVTNDNDQYRDAVHVVLSVDKNTRFVIAYE